MIQPHFSFDASGNPVQPGPAGPVGPPWPAVVPPPPPPPPVATMAPPPDKSVGAAVVLTVLFGPFGLLYSTVAGGLIMLAVDFVIFLISVATLGIGGILFLVTWPITVIWGAVSASNTHRDFEMWKLQVMSAR